MEEDGSEDVEVIAEKTPVCLVSDPTKTGVVMSVSGVGDLAQYSVSLDGQFREKNQRGGEPCIAFRCKVEGVASGRYPLAVYAWNYAGFTSQFKMVTIPRSTLMFQTQLENDTERYEAKVARIKETAARADIVFRKIANGVVIVEGAI